MVTITSLWLAIVLSAVFVWIASSVVWMALPHHKKDFAAVPNEEAARQALAGITEGTYTIPNAVSQASFKDPEFMAKMNDGPVAYVIAIPNGPPAMGKKLVITLGYYLFVGLIVAYLASQALGTGADYMDVFQFTSVVAWAAHGLAVIQDGIWFGKPTSHVIKHLFDAMLYGLLTGGVFGWLWP